MNNIWTQQTKQIPNRVINLGMLCNWEHLMYHYKPLQAFNHFPSSASSCRVISFPHCFQPTSLRCVLFFLLWLFPIAIVVKPIMEYTDAITILAPCVVSSRKKMRLMYSLEPKDHIPWNIFLSFHFINHYIHMYIYIYIYIGYPLCNYLDYYLVISSSGKCKCSTGLKTILFYNNICFKSSLVLLLELNCLLWHYLVFISFIVCA